MSQITEYVVGLALDARLSSFTTGGDLNLEGTTYAPQAGKPYLASAVSAYARDPQGIGPDTAFAVQGTYTIRVVRPSVGGLAAARQIAGQLTVLFARGTPLSLASGQVLTVESCSEMPAVLSGDWVSVPVVVRWYAQE